MSIRWDTAITQGDTYKRKITIFNKTSGTSPDLTNALISYEIIPLSSHPKIIYDTGDYIFLDDPLKGSFRLEVPNTITATFNWKKAKHKLVITYPSGEVKTLLTGTIIVN